LNQSRGSAHDHLRQGISRAEPLDWLILVFNHEDHEGYSPRRARRTGRKKDTKKKSIGFLRALPVFVLFVFFVVKSFVSFVV
jgi:hypothetical protein